MADSNTLHAVYFFFMLLQKNLSRTLSECKTVWIQIGTNILLLLIWVQSVCKGYQNYQKMTKVDFFEKVSFEKKSAQLNNGSYLKATLIELEHI